MPVLAELLRKTNNKGYLFTGEPNLDDAFASVHKSSSPSLSASQESGSKLGIPQHTFTELSGPVGSGKTAIWLALATEVLRRGMNLLYISCKQRPFPFRRAQDLKNWNIERFENRVDQIYIQNFEEFLLLDADWSRFGLIIIEQYDALIKGFQDRAMRERACCSLLRKTNDMAQNSSVVSTSGCIKYRNEEGTTMLAPSTLNLAKQTGTVVRLMCYKDLDGTCVLSTGTKFSVKQDGLVSESPCNAAPVPLHSLASTRKFTPHRYKSSMPLTPTFTQPKRRASISTPSRPNSSGPDPRSQGTPVKKRQLMHPQPLTSSHHCLFQQESGLACSSHGTDAPISYSNELYPTSHPDSQYGDLINTLTPNRSDEVEPADHERIQKPAAIENTICTSIPNSQFEPADPAYKLE